MQIKVCNRSTAEVIKFDVPYIVISIYSTNSEPAKVKRHSDCLDILLIQFDDLTEDFYYVEKNGTVNDLKAITEQQANQIWQFVEKYIGKSEIVLIHCDAGVCRSPAVAAAIEFYYTGRDAKWFKSPYCPNMKVYNTMLKLKGMNNNYEED